MEGFKKLPKIQHFKEGGTVQRQIANFEKRERKTEEKADIAQDKKIVKKAFSIHDTQQHEKKTDLKGLKSGGRAKKAQGTVKKFEKASGQYGAKKGPADKKNIQEAKLFKPAFKCGGKVKKYSGEDGSYVTKAVDAAKSFGTDIKNNILGTPEQNRIAQEEMNKQATKGSKLAKFFGGKADTESAPVAKKCGGKIKKYAPGGAIKKIAAGLAPAAFMGAAVAPAAYKDLTSGYSAKMREARQAEEEAAKAKTADAESAPVAKCGGGKMKRGGRAC